MPTPTDSQRPGVLFRSHDSYMGPPQPGEIAPSVVLRQEVAFERWFFNYNNDSENKVASEWAKRGWAVLALFEGAFKTVIEAIAYVMTKLAELCWPTAHSSAKHAKALKAQARGVYLSAIALYSPQAAVNKVNDEDEKSDKGPYIGSLKSQWEWGTPYEGKLTRWSIECCCDPWVEPKKTKDSAP